MQAPGDSRHVSVDVCSTNSAVQCCATRIIARFDFLLLRVSIDDILVMSSFKLCFCFRMRTQQYTEHIAFFK